jgi:hypothetical protein
MSNGMVERFHKSLHDGMSHCVNATGTNWDTVVPFFLMAYRATPHGTTHYSPFYLLHGREMNLPAEEDLKAQTPEQEQNFEHAQRLENLKFSLREAYKAVGINSRRSHDKNKEIYDRKAKERKFEVNDIVYLFCPARKEGGCQKFRKFWQGPYKVVAKLSELNYRIVAQNGREEVVHVNRLKKSMDPSIWKTSRPQRNNQRPETVEAEVPDEVEIEARPMLAPEVQEPHVVAEEQPGDPPEPPLADQVQANTPQVVVAPPARIEDSTVRDPNYEPSDSPWTRRELQATPLGPPTTRAMARRQIETRQAPLQEE